MVGLLVPNQIGKQLKGFGRLPLLAPLIESATETSGSREQRYVCPVSKGEGQRMNGHPLALEGTQQNANEGRKYLFAYIRDGTAGGSPGLRWNVGMDSACVCVCWSVGRAGVMSGGLRGRATAAAAAAGVRAWATGAGSGWSRLHSQNHLPVGQIRRQVSARRRRTNIWVHRC